MDINTYTLANVYKDTNLSGVIEFSSTLDYTILLNKFNILMDTFKQSINNKIVSTQNILMYQNEHNKNNFYISIPFYDTNTFLFLTESIFEFIKNEQCHTNYFHNFRIIAQVPEYMNKLTPTSIAFNIDVNMFYSLFPNRMNSAEYIDNNILNVINNQFDSFDFINNDNYGIFFNNIHPDIVYINMFGGADYHKSFDRTRSYIDYLLCLFFYISNNETNQFDLFNELKTLSSELFKGKNFIENTYKCTLLYNLERNSSMFNNNWFDYQKFLYQLISKMIISKYINKEEKIDLSDFIINFDSDIQQYQIKNAKLHNIYLKNVGLVDCQSTNCVFENSILRDVDCIKTRIIDCEVYSNSSLSRSYIERGIIDNYNILIDRTHIIGADTLHATITNSFIEQTRISDPESITNTLVYLN